MSDSKKLPVISTRIAYQSTFWHSLPGKIVWTVLAVIFNTIRFPLWILKYIPPGNRPHPDWTLSQAIRVRIVRAYLFNAAKINMKTTINLVPGREKGRWTIAAPPRASHFVDFVSKDKQITPKHTGITWFPEIPKSGGEKPGLVILHFHGGAYAIGDGRTADAGFAAKSLFKLTDATHIACPQYRLVVNPGGRFPSQLQDAITAYVYLINDMGIPPSKIIISGDSAGANLCLALLRYIGEFGDKAGLTLPALALLWSPWVNPGTSARDGHAAALTSPNYVSDYVGGHFGEWGALGLQPAEITGHDVHSPYISFLNNAFYTPVPLYVSGGETETLLPDIIEMSRQFQAIKGNTIELCIEEHCPHDTILTGAILNFEKEVYQAVKRANVFIQKHIGGASKL